MASWSTAFFVLDVVVVLWLVPRIVVQRRESAATLAWVLFILLVPLGGAVFYHFFGTRRLRRKRLLRLRRRAELAPGADAMTTVLGPFAGEKAPQEDVACRAARRTFALEAAVAGNEITMVHGDAMFDALERAIATAKQHVHVESYIFHPDDTGRAILARLTERARAGVEVRLLVDAVGASDLHEGDVQGLVDAGGSFGVFLPVSPLTRPFSVNFRNHRKIVVIDGTTALTGGMNVGDEYRGRMTTLGQWRDTHVVLRGPAALRYQEIFLDDWHFATGERVTAARYYPPPERAGSVTIEVVASGPDQTSEAILRKLFVAITKAEHRVWLTTPYFLPDRAISMALVTAAQRGVDVRLLLPGTSDQVLVLFAGRSQYDELLAAGVRIFEYQRGMLHAKTLVVDDLWATIGSANMDRRSFSLNWEANLVALDRNLATDLARVFQDDLGNAIEISKGRPQSMLRTYAEAGSFLLSPLL
jgi:cardiolipin synthase